MTLILTMALKLKQTLKVRLTLTFSLLRFYFKVCLNFAAGCGDPNICRHSVGVGLDNTWSWEFVRVMRFYFVGRKPGLLRFCIASSRYCIYLYWVTGLFRLRRRAETLLNADAHLFHPLPTARFVPLSSICRDWAPVTPTKMYRSRGTAIRHSRLSSASTARRGTTRGPS